VLETLVIGGRSLPHAVMMMIPEPWHKHKTMSPEKRAFYEYHSCLMEPWTDPPRSASPTVCRSAPCSIRNGLRPLRYTLTSDGLVVMASETGVLDIPAEKIVQKGAFSRAACSCRYRAEAHRPRQELKARVANRAAHAQWVEASACA